MSSNSYKKSSTESKVDAKISIKTTWAYPEKSGNIIAKIAVTECDPKKYLVFFLKNMLENL